jgi:hypothetical protein
MGLYKSIEQSNGITTNYHRVVSVNIITNVANIVEIASYISQQKRQDEITAINNKQAQNTYIHTVYKNINYNQDMNIKTAYDWLKTLPEFDGAQDV